METIQTYAVKSFNHEGVSNSEPVARLNEVKKANELGDSADLTQFNTPVEKIQKDKVKTVPTGNGQ